MHGVAIPNGFGKRLDFRGIDKEANVLTNALLLVDHPETHAGKTLLQIGEHSVDRCTDSVDAGCTAGVGAQRARDFDDAGHEEEQIRSFLDRTRHCMNLWQIARDTFPRLAFVGACPYFALCSAEVNSGSLVRIDAHRLTINREPRLR